MIKTRTKNYWQLSGNGLYKNKFCVIFSVCETKRFIPKRQETQHKWMLHHQGRSPWVARGGNGYNRPKSDYSLQPVMKSLGSHKYNQNSH